MATVPPPPALDEKAAEPAEVAAANKPARGTGLVGGGAGGIREPGCRARCVRAPPARHPPPGAARPLTGTPESVPDGDEP